MPCSFDRAKNVRVYYLIVIKLNKWITHQSNKSSDVHCSVLARGVNFCFSVRVSYCVCTAVNFSGKPPNAICLKSRTQRCNNFSFCVRFTNTAIANIRINFSRKTPNFFLPTNFLDFSVRVRNVCLCSRSYLADKASNVLHSLNLVSLCIRIFYIAQ